MYDIRLTGQAEKDAALIERAGLKRKAGVLMKIIRGNPFQNPPPYEKLRGNYKGLYSRRINRRHRLVYAVLPNAENLVDEKGNPYEGIVKILRMWTHYE
jgi:Txe/YoeB family toxin of toxin-antitoxin system